MARILVVDDEKNIRTLFKMELEEVGHQVETAESGLEALRIFTTKPVDLFIIDIRMPDMTGLELMERIRERDAHVPIVVCTALKALENDFTIWESRVAGFLAKPVDLDELKRTVNKALGQAEP